jgi:hypothetical protein
MGRNQGPSADILIFVLSVSVVDSWVPRPSTLSKIKVEYSYSYLGKILPAEAKPLSDIVPFVISAFLGASDFPQSEKHRVVNSTLHI